MSAQVPAFVINLARAEARRALIQAEAERAGIALTIMPAVDFGTPEGAEAVAKLPGDGPWGRLHAHARACTASHRKALRMFLDTGAAHGLILEDDVFIAPDLSDWLRDIEAYWPEGADVLRLERWRDDQLLVALDQTRSLVHGREIRRLHSKHSGSAGYIVTRRAAETILADRAPRVPMDHLLFNLAISPVARALTTYQVTPALIVQGNEPPRDTSRLPRPKDKVPENRKLRSLKRAWSEVKVVPRLLALRLAGRIELTKITYAAHVAQDPAPTA